MPTKNFDLLIDSVHYSANGKIEYVRCFERRGPSFSDNLILTRDQLISMFKDGKVIVTGSREPYLGSTFLVQDWVTYHNDIISTNPTSSKDLLQNTPLQ